MRTASHTTHYIYRRGFESQIQKVQFSPCRRGLLGVMSRQSRHESRFDIFESHQISSSQGGVDDSINWKNFNKAFEAIVENDLSIAQMFYHNSFKFSIYRPWLTGGPNQLRWPYWSWLLHDGLWRHSRRVQRWADMSIVTVDYKYQPQTRFISDRQSIAEHSGLG